MNREAAHTRVIAIVGPTAVGKTDVGVALAGKVDGEIISADSMALYCGMDIGTAKPTEAERKLARFHLIDVVDPDKPFTVADFQSAAVAIIDNLLEVGKTPLLVGGTGLYVRAVIDGLDIPPAAPNPEIRKRFSDLAAAEGPNRVHDLLAEVDPESAKRLHPNDLKRVIRALEVYEQTGKPLSAQPRPSLAAGARYSDAALFGLIMSREKMYSRIEERIDRQIASGLIKEVESLLMRGFDVDLPAMQGLGYKELAGFIKGERSLDEAVAVFKQSTRRFAKRQLTWFRADDRIRWIDVDDLSPTDAADRILEDLRR